jgi:hypothetical protein
MAPEVDRKRPEDFAGKRSGATTMTAVTSAN